MSDKKLMTLEAMAVALEGIPLYQVVRATGVTYPTLAKMRDRSTTNFTMNVMTCVSDYIPTALEIERKDYDKRQNQLKKAGAI
jgi:hypothetical protein